MQVDCDDVVAVRQPSFLIKGESVIPSFCAKMLRKNQAIKTELNDVFNKIEQVRDDDGVGTKETMCLLFLK